MHIPGQGFSRVRIKTDRDSRIRFADLQGQFFKGESQKGTAENYNGNPSISVRYCVHALPLCLVWRAIVLHWVKPLPLRHMGGDGHKILHESRGDHRRLSLLTIFFHVRVTLIGIESGTFQHATLCASFHVRPNTNYKLYTSFFQILWLGKNSV